MKDKEIEKIIRQYVPQVIHMSLATSHENKPWECEVHFAYDDELHIYFVSNKDARHSQEIAANPNVAGSIVTQHHKSQKVRGVYFEGKVRPLNSVDKDNVGYLAYVNRLGGWPGLLEDIADDGSAALYEITVDDFYLFDNYESGRGKFVLPWSSKV